jgi:hypothetical protein
MKISKEKLIYAGVGLFIFLVLVNSTKKVALTEAIITDANQKSFDHSVLPSHLKPPMRLADGEPLPKTTAKRSLTFSSLGLKPRFDTP